MFLMFICTPSQKPYKFTETLVLNYNTLLICLLFLMANSLNPLSSINNSVFVAYFVFQLTLSSTLFSPSTRSLSHDDECFALFQFKQSFDINRSASSSRLAYPKIAYWKSGTDCCVWDGVECTEEDSGHVVGLDLSSSFLFGHIDSSSSLFNLTRLRRINLSDNDLMESEIPSAIGRLSQLTSLKLSNSKVSGQIPGQISQLTRLTSLHLSHNKLKLQSPGFESLVQNLTLLEELILVKVNISSEVPDILTNFTSLRTLFLDDCGLTGEFPVGIFHLLKLQKLRLKDNENLTGSLPEFHRRSELEVLSIVNTGFSGSLPGSLNNLTKLTDLELWQSGFNEFSGPIPVLASLSELIYLSLRSRKLNKSQIPDWLSKLTKLTSLDLRYNNLYGGIPSSIANLTQLVYIDLAYNQLTGQFPPWLMNMTNQMHISLRMNQLQGPIPRSFSSLSKLEYLALGGNNFSDAIALSVFLDLKKLEVLELGGNLISLVVTNNYTNATLPKIRLLDLSSCNLKVFPDFLRFQNELTILWLTDNKIDGQIPGWVLNNSVETLEYISLEHNFLSGFEQNPVVLPLFSLHTLRLDHNQIQGSFWLPPPNIVFYDVSNNRLIGEIPATICQLKSLDTLDLSSNNMTGTIPPCLGNISSSISVLNLKNNNFRGTVPNTYTKRCKLKMIDFSQNQLEGKVPRSFVNCTMLQYLDLGNNHIDDMFPQWLGGLLELQVLILRSNKFHGAVESSTTAVSNFPMLRVIDLSNNEFEGDLPHVYFQSWTAMKRIDANATYMESNISYASTFPSIEVYEYSMLITNKGVNREYKKILNIFKAIDLSSNKFRGKIPESIGSLRGIQMLNLSNNHLGGSLPSSMGNLTQLESLDLSRNYLSGVIPHQLPQLISLAIFNISYNNFFGPIPQGNQFDTFEKSSYEGNPGLCGVPLSIKCGSSHALTPPPSIDSESSESFPSGMDWVVILLGLGSGLVVGLVVGNDLTTRHHEWFNKKFGKRKGRQGKTKSNGEKKVASFP